MDLLNVENQALYSDEEMPQIISDLLAQAANDYATGTAEFPLLRAYFLAPENLAVLVALYRFFFYQHRTEEALLVAQRCLDVTGKRLNLPAWQQLTTDIIDATQSMGLVRFYLLALKGAAYLKLRLRQFEEARQMINVIMSLDTKDQLGCSLLLNVLEEAKEADFA